MAGDSEPEKSEIVPAEPSIKTHNFKDRIMDKEVNFYVIKLTDSFVMWIGTSEPRLSNLAMAMQTKYSSDTLGSSLFGDVSDPTSTTIAQQLAKTTGKQVFVSYDLQPDLMLIQLVEKRICQEIKSRPEFF